MTTRSREKNTFNNELKEHIGDIPLKEITFFCVGTVSCSGDAYGPKVGQLLKDLGYKNVIGTIKKPVHAGNLNERVKEVGDNKTVIAIDASVTTNPANLGRLLFKKGTLSPGIGVGKNDLEEIGHYEIAGCVTEYHPNNEVNIERLCSVDSGAVNELVDRTVEAIIEAFPLKKTKREKQNDVGIRN